MNEDLLVTEQPDSVDNVVLQPIEEPFEVQVNVFEEVSEENPLPVVLIEDTPVDTYVEYAAEPRSVTSFAYGTINTQYLDYFTGRIQKLKWGEEYVCFRSGQNEYTLAISEDLQVNGSTFTGRCEILQILRDDRVGNNQFVVRSFTDDINVNLTDAFVYSSLGNYPTLERGETNVQATALLLFVGVAFIYVLLRDLFKFTYH